MHYEQQKQ
jgi:hypothetical protein